METLSFLVVAPTGPAGAPPGTVVTPGAVVPPGTLVGSQATPPLQPPTSPEMPGKFC
jgi:hypothetical protein